MDYLLQTDIKKFPCLQLAPSASIECPNTDSLYIYFVKEK